MSDLTKSLERPEETSWDLLVKICKELKVLPSAFAGDNQHILDKIKALQAELDLYKAAVVVIEDDEEPQVGDYVVHGVFGSYIVTKENLHRSSNLDIPLPILQRNGKPTITKSKLEGE